MVRRRRNYGTTKRHCKKVLNYIEDNIGVEINVDKIVKNVGYSKFYLNRIFSEYTGITIYKYLQSRRLTIAAEKLVKTDESIMQIAYDAGSDSQQAFSLAFKQLYVYAQNLSEHRSVRTKAKQDFHVREVLSHKQRSILQ